jgi:dTDP-4-amino-4,6-dideoxygalactose transaminase
MNELTAAVARAQLKKAATIKSLLHEKKQILKEKLSSIDGIEFREVLEENGDVGTLLTFFLPTKEKARKLAQKLGTSTVADSGWHVYNNMEHFLDQKTVTNEGCPFTCPYYNASRVKYHKGMLPQTDELLGRAINISVGVSDAGLGSAYGITINSSEKEIQEKATFISAKIKEVLEN